MSRRTPATTDAPNAAALSVPNDHHYAPTVTDIFALSAALGSATEDEVRLLTAGYTAPELVEFGNDYATERVTDDALRILGAAAAFFQKAPDSDRDAVDLSLEVVRIAAWAAAQDAKANERYKSVGAGAKAKAAGDEVVAAQTIERARTERKKLAALVSAVGQRASTEAAVSHALTLAAHGEASTGPDVSLGLLVKEGTALLADAHPDVQKRATLFKLSHERLQQSVALAAAAKEAAKLINAPKVVLTQDNVDWWDGATYVLLQSVVAAFQGARASHPGVPRLGFVSLRKKGRAATGESSPDDGEKK